MKIRLNSKFSISFIHFISFFYIFFIIKGSRFGFRERGERLIIMECNLKLLESSEFQVENSSNPKIKAGRLTAYNLFLHSTSRQGSEDIPEKMSSFFHRHFHS